MPNARISAVIASLFTVARNLFLSYRRWRLLDADRVQDLFCVHMVTEAPESPFEMLAATELELRFERALAALPLRYREVLLLVAIEGMTPGEAAQVCELKPEALRKRLQRAREMLGKKLQMMERRQREGVQRVEEVNP